MAVSETGLYDMAIAKGVVVDNMWYATVESRVKCTCLY